MHEVLLTRGDVMKADDDVKLSIHVAENCVLIHPVCHGIAGTVAGKAMCVQHLIAFEGCTRIGKWLELVGSVMAGAQATQELIYVRELTENLFKGDLGLGSPKTKAWVF